MDEREKVLKAYLDGHADAAVSAARIKVLEVAASTFSRIADHFRVGSMARDDIALATALLSRLAAELISGMLLLARESNTYAAAALLRQLIEVEYLAFVGYSDPKRLGEWYSSPPEDIRKHFTPQKMRRASAGLFRDDEYWMHCETGGHPHPKAQTVLQSYDNPVDPGAFLLPDAVHHVRRLWTSMSLLLPQSRCTTTAHGASFGPAKNGRQRIACGRCLRPSSTSRARLLLLRGVFLAAIWFTSS